MSSLVLVYFNWVLILFHRPATNLFDLQISLNRPNSVSCHDDCWNRFKFLHYFAWSRYCKSSSIRYVNIYYNFHKTLELNILPFIRITVWYVDFGNEILKTNKNVKIYHRNENDSFSVLGRIGFSFTFYSRYILVLSLCGESFSSEWKRVSWRILSAKRLNIVFDLFTHQWTFIFHWTYFNFDFSNE